MTTDLDRAVKDLIVESLQAWHLEGNVAHATDGALLLRVVEKDLRIARAPAGLPFRWMVEDGERTRTASSVTGLLRHVRAATDTGYRPIGLRIAPLPLALPDDGPS